MLGNLAPPLSALESMANQSQKGCIEIMYFVADLVQQLMPMIAIFFGTTNNALRGQN